MTDTVTQAKREAAMLREIANSEARGVDWSTNLNASADFLEGIAHQPDSALADLREEVQQAINDCRDADNEPMGELLFRILTALGGHHEPS